MEAADIVVNQQVGLHLVHVHHRLEETDLVLVVFVVNMLHGSKDPPARGVDGEMPAASSLRENHPDRILRLASAAAVMFSKGFLA